MSLREQIGDIAETILMMLVGACAVLVMLVWVVSFFAAIPVVLTFLFALTWNFVVGWICHGPTIGIGRSFLMVVGLLLILRLATGGSIFKFSIKWKGDKNSQSGSGGGVSGDEPKKPEE